MTEGAVSRARTPLGMTRSGRGGVRAAWILTAATSILWLVGGSACGSEPLDEASPGGSVSDGGSASGAAGLAEAGTRETGGGASTPDTPEPVCRGPVEGPTAGNLCGCTDDCTGNETCADEVGIGMPGGMCLGECVDDASCPEGTLCAAIDPAVQVCLITCSRTSDCPAGRVCSRLEEGGPLFCNPLCQRDSDCLALGSCDAYTGFCGDLGPHPGTGDIGSPCVTARDCVSGLCAPAPFFPDGTCRADCSVDLQGCPKGSSCTRIRDDEDRGWCMASCEEHEDCREGYACHDYDLITDGVSSGRFVCVAPVSQGDCQGRRPSPTAAGPCGCDIDCDVGEFCASELDTGGAGGWCVRYCSSDAECPEGAICGFGLCFMVCERQEDCGPLRACFDDPKLGVSVCLADCTSDNDCPVLGRCDLRSGSCVPASG